MNDRPTTLNRGDAVAALADVLDQCHLRLALVEGEGADVVRAEHVRLTVGLLDTRGAGSHESMRTWMRRHHRAQVLTLEVALADGRIVLPGPRTVDARSNAARALLDDDERLYSFCRVLGSTDDAMLAITAAQVVLYAVWTPAPVPTPKPVG